MRPDDGYDVVVVGGGPAGATAAADLAGLGHSVLLLDRAGRIKPCGGAIPPRLIRDFAIPDHLLVAHISGARIVAPSERTVDMAIDNGYVGMVDREAFDEWLRARAEGLGATRQTGTFAEITRDAAGSAIVTYTTRGEDGAIATHQVATRVVIGADGANSRVARQTLGKAATVPFVFAYHEIVRSPTTPLDRFDPKRCDIYYQSPVSPDFYGWVFPHGETTSIGTGSARKGFALREAVADLRRATGLDGVETIRREGAPLPLKPLKRWDNGRDVVVVGDAAGVVAPASGEGIYYAMVTGRFAGEAVARTLATGNARELAGVRRRFMAEHGTVFVILRMMQYFWYASDKRRERFVSICRDPDVQRLTWESYLNKKLVRRDFSAHVRIFVKDVMHLFGAISTWGKRI
jgi:geranylgeranyl reductase